MTAPFDHVGWKIVLEMLSKVYGVPAMKAVFQHRFPVNGMVCRDELAVYCSDDMPPTVM
jgi:hypothetical protein